MTNFGPVKIWPALRLHEYFETLADRQPASPAVITEHDILTYAELDKKANALAHLLLANAVETEEAVGVLVERSASLPVAFLAILKAGGAYVPLVADLPAQRLANMAEQSGMRCLIALDGIAVPAELSAALAHNASDTKRHALIRPEELSQKLYSRNKHRPEIPGNITDLAAILFTSGSTGQPKGVLLQHDACINMGHGHIDAHRIISEDRMLLASSPGFILGFRELCIPLLAGAAFVPASRALLDEPTQLLAVMSHHAVSIALFTPSYLRLFQGAAPSSLRCILTAGERPNAEDARHYSRKLEYWNIHGATEVCGTICMHRVEPKGEGSLPSGRPFTNMAVYLLDANGKEVPHGEIGEIHVVGVGVSRGYLNQPTLTAAAFVETIHGRAYRTHDVGRWTDDGYMETLGRDNDVVKVSGQSVSLGEIERTLLRRDNISRAVALQHKGKLIAFVESALPDQWKMDDWHRFLGKTLPSYMQPSQVMMLAEMPISSAGKVDRQALLALAESNSQAGYGKDRTPPQGDLEKNIAKVWEETLDVRPIMRDDNFFAAGGTSLLAIVVCQRLQALGYSVSTQNVLAAPTIATLGQKIALLATALQDSPALTLHQDFATTGQEDFWIGWKIGLPSAGSTISRVLTVCGTIPETTRWQAAWMQLVARHAALRTAFFADEDNKACWRTVDVKELSSTAHLVHDRCASLTEAKELIATYTDKPFSLTTPPLARAGLVQVSQADEITLFWFVLHHSVIDGISARILQEEMFALLLGHALPPTKNGIALASQAEQQYIPLELASHDRAYWQKQLNTLATNTNGEAFTEYATDFPRPVAPSGKSAPPLIERLDAKTVNALTRLAQTHQVGLHGLLLALLTAEVRRRSDKAALIIGSGISVRPAGAETAMGYFVNLLPVILAEDKSSSLAERIHAAQTALTETVEHSSYPSGLIYREFRQQHPHARPHSRTSLFDISLTANPSRTCADTNTDFSFTPIRLLGEQAHPAAGIDLSFSHEPFEENGGGIELMLVWNPDVYSQSTAQAWLTSFADWARWLADDIDRVNAALPALLPNEEVLLAQWEQGPTIARPAKRFHELVEDLVDQHPNHAAVVTRNSIQSYAQLEDKANSIAQALLELGIGHQDVVAVLTDCTADLPAVVLGIWKAGAVYLPLAIEQPVQRLTYMATDAGAKILIVLGGHSVPAPLAQVIKTIICSEEIISIPPRRPKTIGSPQDIAYIVYTSGTTGMPKGTSIQHDSLINVGYMTGETIGLVPEDRISLVATPSFDASLWELSMGLLHGMALVPVSQALRDDPWALKKYYTALGVTVAFHVSSYLRVSKQIPFEGLRILLTGGEAPNHDDVKHHAGQLAFWNAYGPTETCIIVSMGRVLPDIDSSMPLSIGRPLANQRISIRRDNGEPLPPGATGELWLGGVGLSRGYLNNPELTAQRFVDTDHGRFYRSGDLGYWSHDGQLILSGRIDHQVKLHGQRVELSEIEQVLLAHPGVQQAVTLVDAGANETKLLRAFVCLQSHVAMPSEDAWRTYLADHLPFYMVPATVTLVSDIPLTPAGKIDRGALLQQVNHDDDQTAKTSPQGELEIRIASRWEALLSYAPAREDNFFALGGNSLLAVTMAHQLSQELRKPVPARELFATPTLAGFAQRIAELLRTQTSNEETASANSDFATEGEREFWVAETAGLDTRTFTIPIHRVVRGEMPTPARWNAAWASLVARHNALRTYFSEDDQGRLLRCIASALDAALETTTQPDSDTALAFIRQRQNESFVMGAAPLWRAGIVEIIAQQPQKQPLSRAWERGWGEGHRADHNSDQQNDGKTAGISASNGHTVASTSPLTPNPSPARGRGEVNDAANESKQIHLFWLALHHSVGDGHSIGILLQELTALLRGEALPPLIGNFQQSAAQEETYLASTACTTDANYWRDTLTKLPDASFDEWPLDHARSFKPETGCHRLQTCLDADTATALRTIARQHHTSLHAVILTLLAIEVRRRTGHTDFIIGTTASTRESALDAQVIGYYVNMLPLPYQLHRTTTFSTLLRETQQTLATALQHARYPFARMYHDFWRERPQHRHPARYPLFDIAVTENPVNSEGQSGFHLAVPTTRHADDNVEYEWSRWSHGQDMVLLHEALADGRLLLQWQVNAMLYTKETAESWFAALTDWARWLAKDIKHVNAALPALLPNEKVLLAQWEQGPTIVRPAKRFHELVEDLVDQYPNRAAVITRNATQTYAQLEDKANSIAQALLELGITREDVIAVLTECTADLPAVVLGIWKAGAVYLPLALEQPPQRLAYMATDAGAKILIVLDEHLVPAPLAQVIETIIRPENIALDNARHAIYSSFKGEGTIARSARRPRIAGSPQDLAYIVYTSGTTGMPKGTSIQHDSMINVGYMTGESVGLVPEDRVSLVATPSFDASLWELSMGLLHGMALVPVSQALRDDPWALKKYYTELGVTVAFHVSSYLRVSKQVPFEGLRILITGGEAPNHDDVKHHAGHLAFWNAYGPTETCIIVSMGRVSPDIDSNTPLSIGRPLANQRISIRRDNGDPLPPGATGELWLGGVGLSRGYLNNPELTAQRFVDTDHGRFYRSGDLGYWSREGQLVISGRIDHQVKLHGQRVELSEIEQVLLAHPGVQQAVTLVDAGANETKLLRAFVCPQAEHPLPSENAWRTYLADHLPFYMVPATVTLVADIPLTPTGKIDRDALLQQVNRDNDHVAKTPPQGELEIRIASRWEALLGYAPAREDNFFALGGNSLLAVTMAHQLSQELRKPVPARELFAAPTLAAFAQRMAELLRAETSHEDGVSAKSDLTTEGEREFWVAEAAGLDTRTFNIPIHRVIQGEMPALARWNAAWATLVARHDALRTYFSKDEEGRLRRCIAVSLDETIETTTQPDNAAALAFIRKHQSEPFAMGAAPLWRAGIVEVITTGEHLFWLALHHSVGDGHSIGILLQELTALLRGEDLPLLGGNFRESAAQEETYLASNACTSDAAYWRDTLTKLPDSSFDEWPLDHARSFKPESGCHRLQACLDINTASALRTIARQHDASLHAVILTLLAVEVRRRTGHADFIIGTTASTRELASETQVVGYYVNMLPLPYQLHRATAFGTLLRETQQTLATALQHARYPFARMYHDLWRDRPQHRHPARYPLFDIAVTENPATQQHQAALHLARPSNLMERTASDVEYEYSYWSPGQDMVLIHEALADGELLLQWQVNATLYTKETAENWFSALTGWANWLAEDISHVNAVLPALLPSEETLLTRWEHGQTINRPPLRFHEIFENILDKPGANQGDKPAIIMQAGSISYMAVEQEANAIAHTLLMRNVGQGKIIGVLTDRSPHLPATILGIWKAGAIYLPLATDLPQERLTFMARDARIAQLIALDGHAVPDALTLELPPVIRPEEITAKFRRAHAERPKISGDVGDAAYIIYTSGSTGKPKGTLISHEAYANMVQSAGEIFGLTSNDRTLFFASPSFDVSMSDIGVPLAFGAALCPVPYDVLSSPNRFQAFLIDFGVTVADVTPTYLRLFDGADLPSLRILVTGGEAPFLSDVNKYVNRLHYYNAYGPTENTITSSMARLSPENKNFLSSGKPLPNTSAHICDADGNPVPPGVIGELWLGGVGLALGYVQRPELTATSFVKTSKGRRYRSGDLARWHANGELEIIGRTDEQTKLNGIRVELGEIEHALSSHPAIAQAVALVDTDAGKTHSLWAFVCPQPGMEVPAEETWRDYLVDRLPSYMIPAAVIAIAAVPLTPSGKVDKAALKNLLIGRERQSEKSLPQDAMERDIARIWAGLLGHAPVYRDDNFFALGGHSLLAIAVAHSLEKELGHPIPARELFAEPTLRDFAHRVTQLRSTAIPAEVSSDRATEGQREFWIAEQAGLDTRGFNIPLTLIVGGKVPLIDQWKTAWSTLVARHQALRTYFYEDKDAVLRRVVSSEINEEFQWCSHADLPTALACIQERQTTPFVMGAPTLWRAGLVRVENTDQTIFWLSLHHSVGDGFSIGLLVEELTTVLQGKHLSPLAATFDQSAGREETYLNGIACEEDALYWREILTRLGDGSSDAQKPIQDSSKPFDEWPLDFPRPMARTTKNAKGGHTYRIRLDASIANGLRNFSHKNGTSLHALMLTLMALEVRRRTGRPAFLLGTAATTRELASETQVVGYYVNMLPVACRIQQAESVEQTLRAMQKTLATGLQHLRYPFARIYQDFRECQSQPHHPARYPLFDFVVTENPGKSSPLPQAGEGSGGEGADRRLGERPHPQPLSRLLERGVISDGAQSLYFDSLGNTTDSALHYEYRQNPPAQDLILIHESQQDGSLNLLLYVNASLYEKETAKLWIDALAGWARFLTGNNRLPNSSLPTLLPEEEKLLATWQHGPILPHLAPTIHDRFKQLAATQPNFPALITNDGIQSYSALNAKANALAHALLDLGIAPQEPIGVLTDRSNALPETALAIWKSGACYLPLVKDLPAERLAFIARDAGIRVLVILDGHALPTLLEEANYKIFRPEMLSNAFLAKHMHEAQSDDESTKPSDPAYIIYTSGSTGQPKGVVLHHKGMNNLGVAASATLGVQSLDRVLLMASPAFDAWISDLVMAWSVGSAIVPVVREEMNDVAGMRDKFSRLGVTVATMSPSYLRLFEQADLPSLRILMTVGEPPNYADAIHYAAKLSYINGYGPTENTAAASFGPVNANALRLTAGKPVANTTVYIRDHEGASVPPGAIGRVWLGGAGLAIGYLNRPELTTASFVETTTGRNYYTGDLGRWTGTGELQVLGRSDNQIKLRGQRVELGEIEHQLTAYPGVQQGIALVDTQDDGAQSLWTFVCMHADATEPSQGTWHEYLSEKLPSYMLPVAVIRVQAIPITEAGKVDQEKLLRMTVDHVANDTGTDNQIVALQDNKQRTQPSGGVEKRIAQIWAAHLKCQFIAREDNFFDLGGDSLRVIAVVNQIRREFHCTINDLYEHPVLSNFARVCRQRPDHLQTLIQSANEHWQRYQNELPAYEAVREETLSKQQQRYSARNQNYVECNLSERRNYRHVLLTGATGYLGAYLLRELLADDEREVTALVRGNDHQTARARLGQVLCHYFGQKHGVALRDSVRLTVLASDLRRDRFGLSLHRHDQLADNVQAIFHCAANVNHFGHYREFHADNVASTARLLKLASQQIADFHLVSTISVAGKPPEEGFRLFTEYDTSPDVLDENYYIRTKQEAEQLVIAARGELANASIHRVGNLVFAADGGALQMNIKENAFFRQLAAFMRLGIVPDDSHAWLCHVDVIARGLVLLAGTANLSNETHHLENARQDTLAEFITTANDVGDTVRSCRFDVFLETLRSAIDNPAINAALTETLENFGVYNGRSPQARSRRLEISTERTQLLLARLGVSWPAIPAMGQTNMLRAAAQLFLR
ncbi:MAG: amino acid adenylation domain-containing protein [Pseudomonadota bacterium]